MKNIKTIIRQEKIKTWQKLTAVGSHNNRLKQVQNADPAGDFQRLIGSESLVNDVKSLMLKFGIEPAKIRKNGVICNELMLSLSPEYFSSDDYNFKFNKKSIKLFRKRAVSFLKEKYGQRIAHISLHLDETTPHIHCVVVPIYKDTNDQRYKLSAKRFFDRDKLIELQESYYKSFSDLPFIVKYVKKSKATHKDIRTYYGEIQDVKNKSLEKDQSNENEISLLLAANNNLKQKLGALESERTALMAQIYKAKYQIKKLNIRLDTIFKFINIHASHLMDKLPKFVIKLVKQYGEKQNKILDLENKEMGAKSMVVYEESQLDAINQQLKDKSNRNLPLKINGNKRTKK